jgi:capsular polysaccharide export protein
MQHILFISAPFGPFFRKAAQKLSESGHSVWRIVWEGGDLLETPRRHWVMYRGHPSGEEAFIRQVLLQKHITTVITYNDTGRRNQLAIKLARELELNRYVLENGYLRPHWVTLDREGVNGYSKLPKDPDFYNSVPRDSAEIVTFPVRMRDHVKSTMKHFAATIALSPLLPFDPRYYGDSLWRQARHYAKEYLWRITHDEKEKAAEIIVRKRREAAKVFAVLMQKPGDAQLRVHSPYCRNRLFLIQVCESFAAHAPANAILAVKQHPYDYGVERSPRFFRALVRRLGIERRAYYFRKTSIDIVLDNADGLITVNSTGGLTALLRGLPVICCGSAIFDMPGLTFQNGLDRFWWDAAPPSRPAADAFANYLRTHSQLNGGFHHPLGIELTSGFLTRVITENSLAPHHDSVLERSRQASAKASMQPQLPRFDNGSEGVRLRNIASKRA